ncbi:MAG: hypothetical protein HY928_08140 [Elusimicrobia bacterium]|nr:hypothetical protein [Elusimicrobiota bacterium]
MTLFLAGLLLGLAAAGAAALAWRRRVLEREIGELKRLSEVRREFVANVSHELRTPLASIKAYAETLSQGALEDAENRAGFVAEIEAAADRMANLVDDLLNLAALESGRRPPVFAPLALGKAAAEVVAVLMPLAGRKSVVLRLEPFHDIPPVRADREMVKRVFVNLIENAIKYSGDRGVVRVGAEASGDMVTAWVSDNGPGIPAESLPRLFERFYRVDKARSRELGGTGLGLAIVKHIVDVHGGTASAESVVGEGSTFRFTLPVHRG